MTAACPRWLEFRDRVVSRLDRRAGGPSLGAEELAHLDDCPSCRRAALELDASLALRPLTRDERDQREQVDEIEAMRLAVSALRRTGRAPQRSIASWGRAAAALVLFAGALYQLPLRPSAPGAVPPAVLGAVPSVAITGSALGLPAPGALPADFAYEPVVETLDRPDARIYQLGGGDVSVVMIVDETLDV